jgi:hypothetical protein
VDQLLSNQSTRALTWPSWIHEEVNLVCSSTPFYELSASGHSKKWVTAIRCFDKIRRALLDRQFALIWTGLPDLIQMTGRQPLRPCPWTFRTACGASAWAAGSVRPTSAWLGACSATTAAVRPPATSSRTRSRKTGRGKWGRVIVVRRMMLWSWLRTADIDFSFVTVLLILINCPDPQSGWSYALSVTVLTADLDLATKRKIKYKVLPKL